MELRIDTSGAVLAGTQASSTRPRRWDSAQTENAVPLFSDPKRNDTISLTGRKPHEVTRAGFGENTISPAGAAVTVLHRGVSAARSITEATQEVRDRIRAREEARRKQTEQNTPPSARQEREQPPPPPEVDFRRAEAALRSRDFINTLNQAARTAEARLSGQAPPPPENRAQNQATVQVNNQAFTVNMGLVPGAPRLDLLV